ncbi:MAG: hypothetical protein AB7O39_10710 [Flavobacteriaceae bacterium]
MSSESRNSKERRTEIAADIMQSFAARTGIAPSIERPRRYLWTDAFAVCNFLSLHEKTGEKRFLELARDLIDQVHQVLGRHRADTGRTGWISGMDEDEGRDHPTAGGLRIGKKLGERPIGIPYDDNLEWDRDGQYFHYLTKWMHALCQASTATRDTKYLRWAAELAQVAFRAFVHHEAATGAARMYWKMSIDLSRPLVPSMGQHDPLDGYVTATQIATALMRWETVGDRGDLSRPIATFARMASGMELATEDPLGLGGLLFDVSRLAQLGRPGGYVPEAPGISEISDALKRGLSSWLSHRPLHRGREQRLAFRELGLSLGLRGLLLAEGATPALQLSRGLPVPPRELASAIENFWLDESNRQAASWREHEDINAVMLASSLLPDRLVLLG